MKRPLPILFFAIFVVMIGAGITLPVLPFFTERLALSGGAAPRSVAVHVGLLTAVYPLMQFLLAPVWGLWSDKIGRKRLIVLGIAGSAAAQILFAISISLWLLYAARIAGGILSSALFPAAAAYISDVTGSTERSKGMAWIGTATSLGSIAGIALGGLSTRLDYHVQFASEHLRIDGFSIPFFWAAALMFGALMLVRRWLPESVPGAASTRPDLREWSDLAFQLRLPLSLAVASQFGLALFEATFALFAKDRLQYSPAEVGSAFLACGIVMAISQVPAAGLLGARWPIYGQVWAGFALMASGSLLLLALNAKLLVLLAVALLALGMAIISPNLAALVSLRAGDRSGTALGAQGAANSLGQFAGPIVGGLLFAWQPVAPYAFGSAFLLSAAIVTARQTRESRRNDSSQSD